MEGRTHGMGQSGGAATKQKKAMQTTAGRGPDNDKQIVDGGPKNKTKNKKNKKTDGLDIPSLAKWKTTHVRPR